MSKTTVRLLCEIDAELTRAQSLFPAFHSAHEGYAVLLEEVEELWFEVRHNNPPGARQEAIQVAAMALRFIMDVTDRDMV